MMARLSAKQPLIPSMSNDHFRLRKLTAKGRSI